MPLVILLAVVGAILILVWLIRIAKYVQSGVGSVGERLAGVDAQFGHMREQVAASDERTAAAEGIVGPLAMDVAQAKAHCAEQIQTIEGDCAREQKRLTELENTLSATQEQVAGLGSVVPALRGDLDEVRQRGESETAQIRQDLETRVGDLTGKIDGLQRYIEDVFQRDLRGALRSFDSTVSSVLREMKDELLHGVSRIENIEAAVGSRQDIEDRLLPGSEGADKLPAPTDEGQEDQSPTPIDEGAETPEDEPLLAAEADADEAGEQGDWAADDDEKK